MTEADMAFCRDLYTLFEQRRHVPRGFAESFEEWLKASDTVRLVIEFEGSLAGCGGFNLREDPNPEGGDAPKLAVGSLSFGLVHPRVQRHGLGSALLASRIVAIHRMGHAICTLEATTCSVAWLERAGFRFWHTWSTPAGDRLFRGAMVITDEDVSILEAWLGLERIAVLASLNPPPVEVTMPAPDQTWQ
jgi:GNAT superfamily N-acetyltransferase